MYEERIDGLNDFSKIALCLHRWRIATTVEVGDTHEDGEPLWGRWTVEGLGEIRWERETPYLVEWRRDPRDEVCDETIPLRKFGDFCAGLVFSIARRDTVKT